MRRQVGKSHCKRAIREPFPSQLAVMSAEIILTSESLASVRPSPPLTTNPPVGEEMTDISLPTEGALIYAAAKPDISEYKY